MLEISGPRRRFLPNLASSELIGFLLFLLMCRLQTVAPLWFPPAPFFHGSPSLPLQVFQTQNPDTTIPKTANAKAEYPKANFAIASFAIAECATAEFAKATFAKAKLAEAKLAKASIDKARIARAKFAKLIC